MDLGAAFAEFVPKPQSSTPITNASPHVDGGRGGSNLSNTSADAAQTRILWLAAGIVALALAILWATGSLAFRGARF